MVLHCAPVARGKGERGKRRLDAEGGGGGCEGRRVPHWLPAAARTPGGAARSRSVAPPAAGSGGERGAGLRPRGRAGPGGARRRPLVARAGQGAGTARPSPPREGARGRARRLRGRLEATPGAAAGAGWGPQNPPGAAGRLLQVSAARCEVCQGAEKRQKPV